MTRETDQLMSELRLLRSSHAIQKVEIEALRELLIGLVYVVDDRFEGAALAFVDHARAVARSADDAIWTGKAAAIESIAEEIASALELPAND